MSICVPGTTSFKLVLILLKITRLLSVRILKSQKKKKNHTSYLNSVELLTACVEVKRIGTELG